MEPTDAESEAAAVQWEELLEEIVIKHERSSDRRLYVYGISAHRCPQCRSRIKPSSRQCESCQFTHRVDFKCRRCTGEAIAMWCYECDAYYCVGCFSRPHVLSLSASGEPHRCFPIENSSGKCLAKGSWSKDIEAAVQSIYRLQISEKLTAGSNGPSTAAAAQSTASRPDPTPQAVETGQQQAPADSTTPKRPERVPTPSNSRSSAPEETHTQAAAPAVRASGTETAIDEGRRDGSSATETRAAPVSSPASANASPSDADASAPTATTASTESRKRQLNGDSHGPPHGAKQPRTDAPARQQVSQAPAPSSPPVAQLSLYEQVRLMHEKRKVKAGLPPRPHPTPQQSNQSAQPPPEQQRAEHQAPADQLTPSTPQTASEAEQISPPSAPASSPLSADRKQQIVHELEQQQQRLQHAASGTSQPSTSTTRLAQDTDPSRPPNQPTYPVQQVQSPLPSPLPSPRLQSLGRAGVGLAAAPSPSAGVVGFVRPNSHPLEAPPTAMIDLTAPTGPTQSFLRPQAIGGNAPAIDFQGPSGAAAAPLPPAPDLSDEDALLSAVLVDFNAINARVMELESTIQSMMSAVRLFSFQDVAKASMLNAKIAEHRGVLERARARRIQISARVMMCLPAVNEFARGADRGSWGDVPRVLTTCQTRLAQLAGDMSGCEQRVLQLRGLIDEAVSSNDMRRIMQVQELGDQLKQAETRLGQLKTERDSQFVLMLKFSRELREAVQREVALLSRSAGGAAAGSASSA